MEQVDYETTVLASGLSCKYEQKVQESNPFKVFFRGKTNKVEIATINGHSARGSEVSVTLYKNALFEENGQKKGKTGAV